jgi:hypothetical protein
MPHGWEREAIRNRLEKELRAAKAAELAAADKEERSRIEKEIRAELDKRLGKRNWRRFFRRGLFLDLH